ncbi:DUF3592 domain-containing protein [Streptomyces sp. NPDC052225]|uniref:DUF3592 domain-containing protein n=1 Tax=Streptomyces sp. NPDC052225 TaxID=3154949 RepID=UPI00342EE3AF
MDFMFYVIPGIIAAVALAIGYRVLGRAFQLRAAWRSGLTAEARCLRTYTSVSGGERPTTTQHHVFEFTTPEGRTVRFDEANGPATVVQGDVVVVHYTAAHPERATAGPPRPFANAAGTVFLLGFVALMLAFCVYFVSSLPSDGF